MDLVVVGAAIISDGRLLSAQRAEPAHMAGGWELPGGKVDPGESDEEALVRECREELDIGIRLDRRVGGDWRLSGRSLLRVWTAAIVEGEPRALEHLALRWLTPDELYDVDWLPGDRPVIDELERLLKRTT
ncbi:MULTISPECIES: (deoxy)nucleoside triphosphate pyrophosphohydrolase [Actinomadura]|uniref:8-oxo-dGTP diphosphatase n=1 Tax=Actinomadura litoris TaxID=2678616 RepID=A0A7K1L6I6_9ACTN|nr:MULTISPECIES: (deoxy)nucleoside triphosphate pyrophosphohydrolase [Actinomadura]MBT2213966.1 (deoxy)nucleoside triphosphate pyrophosphohydrolase [Actinomadura sp. NEAU-AAG7]MUN39875.1 NUDIX domain-containing protein [Actinomadura litoris]